MTLSQIIRQQPNATTLQRWLKKVPYAAYLGIKAEVNDNDIRFILPEDGKLIGNPTLPAIHGGVVGAFMEQAAAFHLIAKMDKPVLPTIINFSLDYLRPARLCDTYAQCTLTRQGRYIGNVSVIAWQEQYEEPTAIARAHFLIRERETISCTIESPDVPQGQ
ncbi:MAG: PaaI family thioesterase [Halieaceae bacterium]|uniref:PaaI family thioesterase n=1 Tax=Haliea alexandrii TaxID=2448162 RepID=UPI000F0B8B96|nr:PaaI family thioesterase [Haliea alexandrii]MCR9183904.1 PaaI family thioesterase [Halieaceae bacterium]